MTLYSLIGTFCMLALASPCLADSERVWSGHEGRSYVRLHAPTAPEAIATLTFDNRSVHGGDEVFDLTFEGITITVYFEWNADSTQSERVTVEAPLGYVAVPYQITVGENEIDKIQIIEYLGG